MCVSTTVGPGQLAGGTAPDRERVPIRPATDVRQCAVVPPVWYGYVVFRMAGPRVVVSGGRGRRPRVDSPVRPYCQTADPRCRTHTGRRGRRAMPGESRTPAVYRLEPVGSHSV
ncbi:hypothetical protein Nans01_20780 [Nocardiopsis ansamitocini]|uniref:Uncharacterized protein n=1 Tax=Nocardiopsis ansamitocini TaxID=1670832 RepID=A0A9W6P615_9ACTN|nr:hypothetical protein Nans01_20780 [Nocardiopsis ansamitocini]